MTQSCYVEIHLLVCSMHDFDVCNTCDMHSRVLCGFRSVESSTFLLHDHLKWTAFTHSPKPEASIATKIYKTNQTN